MYRLMVVLVVIVTLFYLKALSVEDATKKAANITINRFIILTVCISNLCSIIISALCMYIYCMYSRTEGVGALGLQLPTQLPVAGSNHLPLVQHLPKDAQHLPKDAQR